MKHLEGLDFESLQSTPLRLRATAAALAMVVSGERPSLSRVADLIGVSRQALHKDHKPVVGFVAQLRAEWQPKADTTDARLLSERDEAVTALAIERRKRKDAERQRNRALHHLELSDATVRALSQEVRNVRVLGP